MPTEDQLFRSMAFDRMFNLKPSDHYGDEHLSTDELFERKANDRQFKEDMKNRDQGEILGHYEWDEELQDLKFTPKSN